MKHYLIYVGGHELNFHYHLSGKNFREAVKSELRANGSLEWAWEEGYSVDKFIDWVEKEYGGESVDLFMSDSPIEYVKKNKRGKFVFS